MTEHDIQRNLFTWAGFAKNTYPELKWMFAVPNGGKRHRLTAVKLKAEGVKAGVADVMLPAIRGNYGGLWVEMKTPKGRLTPNQKQFLQDMDKAGYKTAVCFSTKQAIDEIEQYLSL